MNLIHNLSHTPCAISFEAAHQALIDEVKQQGDLPYASLEKQLELIEQIAQFEFGRFLMLSGGG